MVLNQQFFCGGGGVKGEGGGEEGCERFCKWCGFGRIRVILLIRIPLYTGKKVEFNLLIDFQWNVEFEFEF